MISHYVKSADILEMGWKPETSNWIVSLAEEAAALFENNKWTWHSEIPDKWDISEKLIYMVSHVVNVLSTDQGKMDTAVSSGRLSVYAFRSTNGDIRLEVRISFNLGALIK